MQAKMLLASLSKVCWVRMNNPNKEDYDTTLSDKQFEEVIVEREKERVKKALEEDEKVEEMAENMAGFFSLLIPIFIVGWLFSKCG